MDTRPISLAAVAAAVLLAGCGTHAQNKCAPLGSAAKAKLVDYVQKKFRVAAGVPLDVSELSRVGSSCYDRLVFQAPRELAAFRVELVASPDFRFLSREIMDSQVDPIAEELRKHRTLTTGLTDGGSPALGPGNAPVTLVVFSDFQCPWCARLADMLKREVLPAASGRVRVVYRFLPLAMHAWARPAAEAAACAQEQGDEHFWRVHDFLFEHQRELTGDTLQQRVAEETRRFPRFDGARFKSCISEGRMAKRIDTDMAFAARNGLSSTPTVFLNGQQVQVVGPEQLRTLIGQLSQDPGAAASPMAVAASPPRATAGQACATPSRGRAESATR
jgi:protein-disulfide isomerase